MTASRPAGLPCFLLLVASALAACSPFRELRSDLEAYGELSVVRGDVKVSGWQGLPIVVVALAIPDDSAEPLTLVDVFNEQAPGRYWFRARPGTYRVGAFEDQDRDGKFDDGERGTLSRELEVKPKSKVEGPELVVAKPFRRSHSAIGQLELRDQTFASGEVVPLSDARFSRSLAGKGMWQPLKFAAENRPGVYFLQPYDPAKVPVLFIPGMSGYPQQFARLIERLDGTRFQPWVFLYPSGMPIQTMSSFLVRIIKRIQATHQFGSLCVVAHSMGSLVARSFVGQYEAELPEHPIRTLVTIAGPFTGIPFASWGLRMSPSVVPSWYDISPDSEFLAKLYRKPLSERVEYHLLFAFDDSGDSDSVVYMLSQLRSEAQGEAELVRGYRATHVGALRSDALAAQVLRALDRGAGNTSLALAAPRPPEPKVIH